ncbi:hypothetical protein PWT90_07745 [Aphanocladium album]|nr:hypothetical protein PWT90_07745 [Aphanocladium album]
MPTKRDAAAANQQRDEAFAKRTTFYVNMEWEADTDPRNNNYLRGQMYVECLQPQKKTKEYPLVLIHGDYHSSQIWLTKPDGGPGWASYFLGNGYQVYIVDLPGTGKSNYLRKEEINSTEVKSLKASQVEKELTAPKAYSDLRDLRWETVLKHDKWPGTGQRGDPAFDMYCAHLAPLYFSAEERQTLAQNALKKLLEYTGKVVLIGEGTGATAAWLAADVAPESVVGVVGVEPPGPPFCEVSILENNKRKFKTFTKFDPNRLKYGLANIQLTYDPPARPEISSDGQMTSQHPLDLALYVHEDTGRQMMLQYSPDERIEDFVVMDYMTNGAGPQHVRKLVNLQRMRHVLFTGQASSHSAYDVVTMRFMKQAGLTVDCGFLERYGTGGNGHLMFLETNSDEVAAHVMRWIDNRAGHVDMPGPVPRTEVTIASRQSLESPSPVIDLDEETEEPVRSSKRVKVEHSKRRLVDLTSDGHFSTTDCASQGLHNTSEGDYVLSTTWNRIPPPVNKMTPRKAGCPGTPRPMVEPLMGNRIKIECHESPPKPSMSFRPAENANGSLVFTPTPTNDTTAQNAIVQTLAAEQNGAGNNQQQLPIQQQAVQQQDFQDDSFTTFRFRHTAPGLEDQETGQGQQSTAQYSSNPPQTTPRQLTPTPLDTTASDATVLQYNPYLWPLQGGNPTSSSSDEVPRSMPSLALPIDDPTNVAAPEQEAISADPVSQWDDASRNFQYDLSVFDGMSAEDFKAVVESCDFTIGWQT